MLPTTFSGNLFALVLLFALAAAPAQARLGSDKMDKQDSGTLMRIFSTLKSLVLPQDSSPDTDPELVAAHASGSVDKRVLHEQIMAMIRNSLTRDIIIGAGEGFRNTEQVYMFYVPENAVNVELSTHGGRGDIDLYVMRGNIPTTTRYDCRSRASGTRQSCVIPAPEEGIYYVMLVGNSSYSGISITGTCGLATAARRRPGSAAPAAAPAISAADARLKSPSI